MSARYRLARGVRLRHAPDGVLLLVPEGVVTLNDTAAEALALLDGRRTLDDVVLALGERFDDPGGQLACDVRALVEELASRGFVGE